MCSYFKGGLITMLKIKGSSNNQVDEKTNQTSTGVDEVEALKKKLYTDAVLGCQNRTKYEEDIKSYSGVGTLFSVDGNNLKYINDTFSHEAGDFLLGAIAKAGMKIWSDNFYRSGGDEFLVYISDKVQTDDECKSQIKAFKAELVELNKEKPDLPISASVGYACTSSGVDISSLLEEADTMMYEDKRAYKESHPEYDMRRAKVTIDTVKQAIEDGTFHEYMEQRRQEQGKEVEKDIWSNPGVEIDEVVEAVPEDTPSTNKLSVSSVPEDFDDLAVGSEEEAYRQEEFTNKVAPIVDESAKKAVSEAVKAQNDKMKLEISEVLQDEVSFRLGKYERRRRRRDLREKIGFIIKGVVILLVIALIFGNAQLRLRISLIAKDAGELISDLFSGRDTSSNKLVEDLFRDLGNEINEVNTIEQGFNINDEGGNEDNE